MIIKPSHLDTICCSIPDKGTAKDFLDTIGEKFNELHKVEVGSLMSSCMKPNMVMWMEYNILYWERF